jgi:2-oxoglutarate ferredoxin oxidoreductase subunit beta
MDSDRKHLTEVLRQAAEHRGTALVEIYQNCPIFNDGAFDLIKDREQQEARLVHLVDGEPVRLGTEGERQVLVRTRDGLQFVPEAEAAEDDVVVHRVGTEDPAQAFAISRLDSPDMTHVPMGVFRSVARPTYDDLVRAQVGSAVDKAGGPPTDADLERLIHGRDTWTVA